MLSIPYPKLQVGIGSEQGPRMAREVETRVKIYNGSIIILPFSPHIFCLAATGESEMSLFGSDRYISANCYGHAMRLGA